LRIGNWKFFDIQILKLPDGVVSTQARRIYHAYRTGGVALALGFEIVPEWKSFIDVSMKASGEHADRIACFRL